MSRLNIQETLKNIKSIREAYKKNLDNYNKDPKKYTKPNINIKTLDLMEKMALNSVKDYSKGRASIQEALTTTDAVTLIPKVIEGQLREAAEPSYLGTNFMNEITVDSNAAIYVVPVVGELRAMEVQEASRYNESNIDFNTIENHALEVRVKKIGVRVAITDETIQDSQWDVLGMNVKKMGRAMARYKEEWIFNSFSTHGKLLYDNSIRAVDSAAGTTGLGKDGNFNDTLSVEDLLDMVLAIMANGFVPTDVIMHPLVWIIFARNAMIGNGLTFGAFGGQDVSPWNTIQGTPGPFGLQNNGQGQKLIMKPEQVQNRLPVPLTFNFSPFTRFDKVNKKFDVYCIDRSEVGVIVKREGLSTEDWREPERDIRNIKAKERYGVGVLNNGRAITVAKDISVDVSYPEAPIVRVENN